MLQVCLLQPNIKILAADFVMRELLQQLLCSAGKSRRLPASASLKISQITVDCLNAGVARLLPVQMLAIACAATLLQGRNELSALPFDCCHHSDSKLPLQYSGFKALSTHCCIRQQCVLRSVEVPKTMHCSHSPVRVNGTAAISSCNFQRCDVLQARVFRATDVPACVPAVLAWATVSGLLVCNFNLLLQFQFCFL